MAQPRSVRTHAVSSTLVGGCGVGISNRETSCAFREVLEVRFGPRVRDSAFRTIARRRLMITLPRQTRRGPRSHHRGEHTSSGSRVLEYAAGRSNVGMIVRELYVDVAISGPSSPSYGSYAIARAVAR